MDNGLRYKHAGESFATAQDLGKEPRYVRLSPLQFICIPVKKGSRASALSRETRENLYLLKKALLHPHHWYKKGNESN